MSAILALLVLLFAYLSFSPTTESTEHVAVTAPTPTLRDGGFSLPPPGTIVIHARASNGSLPPEYQTDYEITIDTAGRAVLVERPVGWAASPPTAEERTETTELGEAGLLQLLAELDAAGFFLIPQADVGNEPPPGAGTSNITVTLADGIWAVQGGVTGADRERLDAAQRLIADAVGYAPPDELVSP